MTTTAMEKAQQHLEKSGTASRTLMGELKSKLSDKRVVDQISGVIPHAMAAQLSPDRLIRVALGAVQGSQYLQQCSPISIMGAIIQAAQLGLVPDGLLGHAYLVPRRVKGVWTAQMQMGYRGAIQLVYRTDKIKLRGRVVREGDTFEQREGTEMVLTHHPVLASDAPVICAYATALFPDGSKDFRVLSMREIEKARATSDSFKRGSGPWIDWPEAMMEKTAIHKLAKQLPLSADAQRAIAADDATSAGKAVAVYREGAGVIDVEMQITEGSDEPEREAGQEG